MLHAFAPPVAANASRVQPSDSGSSASRGIGSNCQRGSPVRASNARTAPLGLSARQNFVLSADPMITMSSMTTGGAENCTSPSFRFGASSQTSGLMSIVPSCPKPAQRSPVSASSPISRRSFVPVKIRCLHADPLAATVSSQYATPRQRYLVSGGPSVTSGSNTQRSRPVAGSSAITRFIDAHSTTDAPAASGSMIGVTFSAMNCPRSG